MTRPQRWYNVGEFVTGLGSVGTGLEQAGDRLGRYIIERRIAVGGMAELFLARLDGPEGFSKSVVIKRILPRLRGNHQFTKMFADEARLAARFSHPNLVQVFELSEHDGEPILVMEFVDGTDVGSVLKRSHRERVLIPIRIAAYLIGQVAQGLHAAHQLTGKRRRPLNVIHRDVSPENILVTRMGGVKVIDFGIAKHDAREAETVVGTVKGKVAYMSPEQLLRRHLDRRSDVFSLGVVFYELLTGEQCFTGDSALQQMMAVEKASYRPIHTLRPKVPPDVEAVVDRMMALRPQDRFQTARD
ncbi:MAG: serine/threonine-protein kinase, partial [Myxococcota bacterium]